MWPAGSPSSKSIDVVGATACRVHFCSVAVFGRKCRGACKGDVNSFDHRDNLSPIASFSRHYIKYKFVNSLSLLMAFSISLYNIKASIAESEKLKMATHGEMCDQPRHQSAGGVADARHRGAREGVGVCARSPTGISYCRIVNGNFVKQREASGIMAAARRRNRGELSARGRLGVRRRPVRGRPWRNVAREALMSRCCPPSRLGCKYSMKPRSRGAV